MISCMIQDMRNRSAGPELHIVETVFLDRDGVINEKMPEGHFVRSVLDLRLLPGVPKSIQRLNCAGIRVIVVTNQRGVALGLYPAHNVKQIHEALASQIQPFGAHVDGFYFCPHNKNECNCRKPKTGLFKQACADFPLIDPKTSIMIGDSLSDVEFAKSVGMPAIFIRGPRETQKHGAELGSWLAQLTCESLSEAVDLILSERPAKPSEPTNLC